MVRPVARLRSAPGSAPRRVSAILLALAGFTALTGCSDSAEEPEEEPLRLTLALADGTPVPSARARFLPAQRWRTLRDPERNGEPPWLAAERLGDPLPLDGDATAEIREPGFVIAWTEGTGGAPGHVGGASVTPGRGAGGRTVLTLVPDRSVQVAIRTADDGPAAGVPITVRGRSGADLGRWVTGAGGAATVRNLPLVTEGSQGPFRAVVLLPTDDVLEGPITETGALSLALPPTGRVEATVTDHEGAPVAGAPVEFEALRPPARDASRGRWPVATTDADGTATFPWVPLDQRLRLSVPRAGFPPRPFAGPARAGDTVRIAIRQESPPPEPKRKG